MGKGWIAEEARLDLSHARLSAWPHDQIEQVGPARIRALDLDGNDIAEIPGRELLRLSNLCALHLAGNRLLSLPAEAGLLPDLEVLDVRNNPLVSLPPAARASGEAALAYLRAAAAPWGRSGSARPVGVEVVLPTTPSAPFAPIRSPLPPSSPSPAAASHNPAAPPSPNPAAPTNPPPPPSPAPPAPSTPAAAADAAAACPQPPPPAGRPSPPPGDPRAMRVADVAAWLRSVELGRLAHGFERNCVDGKTLLGLTEQDLADDLHVESGVLRRKVLSEIAELAKRCQERPKTVREFIEDEYNPVVTDLYHAAIDYWTSIGIPVALPEGYPRDVSSMRVTLVEIVKYDLYVENWRYANEVPKVYPDTKLIENEVYRCVVPRHLNAHVSDAGDIYVPQCLLASCAAGLPMLFLALLPADPRYDPLYTRVLSLAAEVARVRCPLDPRQPIYAKHCPGPRLATPAPPPPAAPSPTRPRRSSSVGPDPQPPPPRPASPLASPRRALARARSSSVGPLPADPAGRRGRAAALAGPDPAAGGAP